MNFFKASIEFYTEFYNSIPLAHVRMHIAYIGISHKAYICRRLSRAEVLPQYLGDAFISQLE
jgi:hypothetical protein